MKKYPAFLGVYAADTLPRRLHVSRPCGLIVNTDRRQYPGTHWVAMFFDKRQRGEFFDPYGLPPMVDEHLAYLQRHCVTWCNNTTTLQSPTSALCGHYCLLFLHHKLQLKKSTNKFLHVADTQEVYANDAAACVRFVRTFGRVATCRDNSQTCRCSSIKPDARGALRHSTSSRRDERIGLGSVVRAQRGTQQARVRGSRPRSQF